MIIVDLQTRQAVEYLTRGLDTFTKNSAVQEGLSNAARVFMRRGKSNLRGRIIRPDKGTGGLIDSFRVVYRRQYVMSLAGYSSLGRHAHLVDLGTKKRSTKAGLNRGVMPANYFWSDARNSEEQTAMSAMVQGIEIAISRINNRM